MAINSSNAWFIEDVFAFIQCQAAIVDSLQGAAKEQIVFSYCVSMNSDVVIHITQIGNIP